MRRQILLLINGCEAAFPEILIPRWNVLQRFLPKLCRERKLPQPAKVHNLLGQRITRICGLESTKTRTVEAISNLVNVFLDPMKI